MPRPLNVQDLGLKEEVETLLDREYPEAGVKNKPKLKAYRHEVLEMLSQFNDETPLSERKDLRSRLQDYVIELRGESDENAVASSSSLPLSPGHTITSSMVLGEGAVVTKGDTVVAESYTKHEDFNVNITAGDDPEALLAKMREEKNPQPSDTKLQQFCKQFYHAHTSGNEPQDLCYVLPRGIEKSPKDDFDVSEKIAEFLDIKSDRRVLLLQGGAGAGKSLFCQRLAVEHAKQYLEQSHDSYLPVLIQLPSVRAEQLPKKLVEEGFKPFYFTAAQIQVLKQNQKVLFILDGYDEVPQFRDNYVNLYVSNALSEWKQAKVIFGCRSIDLSLKMGDIRQYFMPKKGPQSAEFAYHLFQEITIIPFRPQDVESYIGQYITANQSELENSFPDQPRWLEKSAWLEEFKALTGLEELTRIPLNLKITMRILPEVVERYQQELKDKDRAAITRDDLYEAFFEDRFMRQQIELIANGERVKPGQFAKRCWEFATQLAQKMEAKNFIEYEETWFLADSQAFDACPVRTNQDGRRKLVSFQHETLKVFLVARDKKLRILSEYSGATTEVNPPFTTSVQSGPFTMLALQQALPAAQEKTRDDSSPS